MIIIEANTAIDGSVVVISVSYPLFSNIRIKMIIMMILQIMIITMESYTDMMTNNDENPY